MKRNISFPCVLRNALTELWCCANEERHCFVILLSGLGGNSNRLLVAYSLSLFIHINFLTNRFFKTRVANTSLFFKLHYECHSVILLGLRSHLFLTCCRQSTLLISRELSFFFIPEPNSLICGQLIANELPHFRE